MTAANTPLQLKSDHAETWALIKGKTTRIKAKAGSHYRVVASAEDKEADATGVSASRHADNLHLDLQDDTKVVIENFYGECRTALCSVDLAGDKSGGYVITGDSPAGATLADGSALVYAYGQTTPLIQSLGVSENLAGLSSLAGMSTYIPPSSVGALAISPWAVVGGAGLVAAAGTTGAAAAAVTPSYTITVTALAGKFIAADQVNIYDKDGNYLAQGQLNTDTGQYVATIANGYRGPILVKVIDNNQDGADFNDESTGLARSLGTDLRAMALADGSTNVAVTVSPLTELATRKAGITTNKVTEADVLTNQKVAKLFGLTDITGPTVTVVDSNYNETDGVSAAEQYGKVLAALSGADEVSGSVDSTLKRLDAAIVSNTADTSQLAIKQTGVDLISAGAEKFEQGTNSAAATLTIQNSQKAPWVVGASDGLNTTTEAGTGTGIQTEIGSATAGTVIKVTWGTQSFNYTLKDSDITAGVATIPVAASVIAAAGDGDIAITTTIGSNPISPAVIIVVDTSAPTALPDLSAISDTGASATDNVTSVKTPVVSVGQLPAGVNSVELLVNGQVLASTYNTANGEITPNTPLGEGANAISYRYVRGIFTGAASPALTVTIDSAAPATPTIASVSDNTSPVLGTVADGGASNDATPTLTGTAEANATVTLYNGSTVIGTSTADGTGNWSFTPATALANGNYSITAKAVDTAGNESPASTVRALTIDTAAPSAPVTAPDLTAASDTGISTDNITQDATPSLAVTAPANGVTVKLYVNGIEVAATYANGEITPTTALGDGIKTLTYSYVDVAGNESPQSPALAVTVDTTAATDPTANPSGGRLFTGTAEPGTTVTLSWTEGTTPKTTTLRTDANGNWRYPDTGLLPAGIPNGTVVSVTSTDLAGNPAIHAGSVTVNILPPTFDSINDDAGRTIGSVANNARTDDTTPTLSGTTGTAGGGAGDVLKVFNGNTYLGSATINTTDGTWSFTPSTPLAEGAVNLSVKWVSASNTLISNGGSSVFAMTIDTTAPSGPVNAPDLIAADDSGISNSDNITSATQPTLNLGSGLMTSDVTQAVVYVDGTETPGTYNPSTGDFLPNAALTEGPHSITYKLADAAGNLSTASPALSLTIDTTAPSAPTTAPDLSSASDTGSSATDDLTADNTPSFQIGALPSGTASVKLYVDGVEVAATYNPTTGEVTSTVALGDGTKAVTYKYLDAAGNLSAASPALSITVDTTAPLMPAAAPDLTNASDTGASPTDNITSDATPSFAISAPASGDTVKLYVDGVEVAATLVNGELTPASALGEGSHVITYRYVDAAGNTSPASAGLNITIDTTAPSNPLANPTGGRLLTGVAEPGDTVTLSWTPAGGTPQTATVTANANGGWRYPDTGTPAINLPDGTAVTVTAADPAGNPAPGSATVTVSISGPTIDSVTDDVARVLGTVANNGSTNDTQPTLSGSVGTNTGSVAGDYLRIFNGTTYLGDAVVDTVIGTWSYTPSTALTEGSYALTAQWVTGGTANTNDGTNASNGASSAFSFSIDTTAPAAPTAPDLLATSDTGASATDDNTADATPSFAVVAPATGETIKLYVDGVEVACTYDAALGTLTPTLPLGDGVHKIAYGYVDAAGNVGAKSPELSVTIDTTTPAAPSAPDLLAASDTGASTTDDQTADTTPSFSVAAPAAGASLQLFVDGVEVAASYDTATGTLTPTTPLADGVHAITYRITDAAGNVGAPSSALAVTIDTAAPLAPLNAPDLTAASDTGDSQTDNLTRDTTPSFAIGTWPSGVAQAKLYVDGVLVAASYDAVTGELTPTTALSDGAKSITYTLVDAAGNESAPSAPLSVTIDSTGSALDPTANPSSGRALTGSAEPGDTVTLTWTEGGVPKTATVVASANGTWSYSPATQIPNATVVTATATDPAGNPATHTATVTVDINAPTLDSVIDNLALHTGEIANGALTNDPTLTLSGMIGSASGNYLRVFDGSTYLGDAVVDSVTSTWSFTTPALAQASHNLQVKWVSGGTAGTNDGMLTSNGASSLRSVTVDTTGPTPPTTAPDLIAAHDSGASSTDNVTNVTQPTLNLGTGLIAGEVTAVEVTVDGATVAGTYNTVMGDFVLAQPLAAGDHAVTFKLIDAAGNTSTASPTLSLTVDNAAPAAPAITSVTDDAAPVTGSVANAGSTNDSTPTVAGSAEANATVKLYNGNTLIGTTTADGTGAWSFTPTTALAEGIYSITAKATDAAGNESADSTAQTFTVDTTAPATPSAAPDLTTATDTGSSTTDNITQDTTPSFAIGQLPTGVSTVKLLVDGAEVAATYDPTTGEITPNTALGDGTKSVTYQYVDAAGNIGAVSPALIVTIDATAPAAPAITSVTDDAAPVTGTVANAGYTNDTTPTMAGTAEANATVKLYNGATLVGTTTADATGARAFTHSTALTEGVYTITAKATDAAGNESAASTAQTFTVDTTAPATPAAAPDLTAASDTGSSTTDNITQDTTPSFAIGQLPTGVSTVKLLVDGAEVAATYDPSTGEVTPNSPLADGTKSVTYIYVDAAGNPSEASPALSVTIDATAPAAPAITSVTDDVTPVTGTVANAGNTNDTTPTIAGTAEANATVKLYNGNTPLGTTTADSSGAWTFTTSTALAEGSYAITAKTIDAAGNESAASTAQTFTVDTTAPATPSAAPDLTAASDTGGSTTDNITQDTTPSFAIGQLPTGVSTVKLLVDGVEVAATYDPATGEVTPNSPLTDGTKSVSYVYVDAAGNPSAASPALSVTIDNAAPAAPAISSVTDDLAPATGTVANAGSTNDTTPTIAGTAESNATVTLYNGVTLLGTTTADGSGNWAFTPSSPLTEGTHTITAKATDAAGNESPASTARTFTLDTTAPAAPVITSVSDNVRTPGLIADSASTDDATPTFSGTADAGVTVNLYNGITLIGSTTADMQGDWSFTPSSALASASYSITAQATDAAGNVGASSTAKPFRIDATAPTLSSSSPADNATTVNAGDNIVLTFSEAVQAGSGNIVISNGTDTRTISITDSTQVTISSATVTINPTADLQLGSAYNVQIAATALKDAAGNPYAGIANDTTLNFTSISPAFKLQSLSGSSTEGFAILGELLSDASGYSVSNAGDVNGDGLDDLIIGASYGGNAPGKAYVVFGSSALAGTVHLRDVAAGTGGFVMYGAGTDKAGYSVSDAGDVNGDGLDDLLVGTLYADPSAGRPDGGQGYVVYGKTDGTAIRLTSLTAGTSSSGFVINGASSYDKAGWSVSAAGDVNGDGMDDIIVGAPAVGGNSGGGQSYIVFGTTAGSTAAVEVSAIAAGNGGFVIDGGITDRTTQGSGGSVSAAGDVNGDGLADLIIGANSQDGWGRSFVVFGKTGTSAIALSTVATNSTGFVINGFTDDTSNSSTSGYSVSTIGDVNGDGLSDLIVGAPYAKVMGRADTGRSFVVFGKTDAQAVNLSAVAAGTGGFMITGETTSTHTGWSVSGAGDINGDGLGDMIIGAPQFSNTGRSYLVYGKSNTTSIDLSAVAAGSGGIAIDTDSTGGLAGHSVSAAGDVNGDGLDDLLIGAYLQSGDAGGAGRSYVIFGSTGGGFATASTVDIVGTTGDDTLSDGGAAKTIIANTGNDTITATAASVVYAGAGNDRIEINGAMITALQSNLGAGGNNGQLVRVDGGGGLDTLALNGSGLTLNLTAIADQAAGNTIGGSRLDSIERIDLTGTGNNTLTLNPADIRDMAGMNLFNNGNGWTGLGATVQKHQLLIDGNAGDVLNASGTWNDAGTITVNGQTYAVYNDQASATQLLVDTDITRNINAVVDAAPTLSSSSPTDNATGIAAGNNIVLTFSEAILAGTGNIVISNGTDTRTISITDTSQVTISGGTVTINPSTDLQAGTTYNVQMASGVLKDATGNNYAGISDATTLNFKIQPVLINAFQLSTIAAGSSGFTINGITASAGSQDLSLAGDINGDGLEDMLVSGTYINYTNSGRTYVVFGKTDTAAVDVTTVAAQTSGFVINGECNTDYNGESIASAGDINGDGLADLIIGARRYGSDAGRSYVVFGKTDTSPIDLSALGTNGFIMIGEGQQAGRVVTSLGDVNGDGLTDLMVNSAMHKPNGGYSNEGRSYVVFGKTDSATINLSTISATAAGTGGFAIIGAVNSDIYSNGSAAGDVNGDGLADILVGTGALNPHVVFGQTGTNPISVSNLSTSGKGFDIQMEVVNGALIPSMTVAGDVNGDGLADLIIGVPVSKKAYVVFGKTDTTTVNLSAIGATASGVGSGGFVINGWSAAPSLGQSVSSAGDVNGDGLTDLLIGTNADTQVASAGFARAYVVYGKTDTVKVDLSNLVAAGGGSIGFAIYGNPEVAGGRTHQVKHVSAAGDVNGDGLDDLIVGAEDDFSYIPGGVQMRTRQYVIFGGDQFATTVDYLGNATDNTLSGSASSETFVGGRGNDTLTGAGGADVIYGGAGNDVIVINADNAAKLVAGVTDGQLARIDGGTGIDTLRLGGTGIALNLAGIANVGVGTPDGLSRVEDIEKIDLATGNSVSLTAKDVIDMAGMNVFNDSTVVRTSGTLGATVRQHQVWVDGDATDTLVLSRTDTWNTVGTIVSGGQTYNVMQHSSAAAQLIVDADIVVRKAMVMNISSEVQSDGALKLDEAADGTVVTVLIDQTGAVAGNTVKVNWGGQEVSQVLQAADISAGSVAITVSRSVLRAATAFGTSSPEIVSAGLYNGTTVLQNTANTNVSVDMRGIASVELSSSGATVLVINGHTTNDNSGYSVSAAGDINGDGFEDLIIGAYKSDPGTTARTDAGRTYVVFAKNSIADPFPLYYVSSSAYGGFAINGQCTIDYSGNSVSAAGDVNGDGLADLIVGAYYRDPYGSNEGSSYVVFGKTTTTELELSTVAAGSGGGFAINGGASNEYLGTSVSAAGDVNGDGLADLIVGAPNSNTAAGHAYVIFGKTGSAAVNASALAAGSTDGFVINGQCANDQVGYSVSSAGDVNGDGLADVLIGAKNDASFAGRSYVVFGKASTTAVNLSAVAGGTGGFVINAQCADQSNGFTVSALGDVNGDGLSDLIVGAPYSKSAAGANNGGRSYVVFGKSDNTSPVDLTAIAGGTGGFAIYGAAASEWTGWSVSNAGDINGDGLTDMILGTSQSTPAGRTNAGRSYVVFGKANGTTVQISDILVGDGGFVINGQCAEDWSGRSVSAAGDLNGDGFDDLVIGAVQGDSAYGTNSGNSYVVFGGSQFATNVDFLGTSNDDALNGSSTTSNLSETFVAGRGNDTITGGGGADVMLGGGDNDIFVLNADNIAKLSAGITDGKLARVDGGAGLDILRVMGGASLNLTAISNVGAGTPDGYSRIESIEKIDLATDTAANTLTIRVKDVIDMSGMNLFNVNGTAAADSFHQLMVKGDAGDTVNIGTGWTALTPLYTDATDSNRTYKVYQDSAAHAQVLIDNTIVTASHVI